MRRKTSAEIRRDAQLMAERKRAEGCEPCAQGYEQLAAKHQPTRRKFLQWAIGAVSATAGLVGIDFLRSESAFASGLSQQGCKSIYGECQSTGYTCVSGMAENGQYCNLFCCNADLYVGAVMPYQVCCNAGTFHTECMNC
jgi:hypothetical protein